MAPHSSALLNFLGHNFSVLVHSLCFYSIVFGNKQAFIFSEKALSNPTKKLLNDKQAKLAASQRNIVTHLTAEEPDIFLLGDGGDQMQSYKEREHWT